MIKIIHSDTVFIQAAQQLQELLVSSAGQKTLLLLSGGSAVKVYEELLKYFELNFTGPVAGLPLKSAHKGTPILGVPQPAPPVSAVLDFSNLTVALVDERFSLDPNHAGSNAAAIEKTGLLAFFRTHGAQVETILHGKSMEDEVNSYNAILNSLFSIQYSTIGVFGIGQDGHTAGIFPAQTAEEFKGIYGDPPIGEAGLEDEICIAGHHQGIAPFTDRITITPSLIAKLDQAILVAQGENKKEPLERLSKASREDSYQIPAVLLKQAKNLTIFTDQIL